MARHAADDTLPDGLDGRTLERAYRAWAPVYDLVCGPIFERARRAAAEAAASKGGHVLEIGVGTGLSMGDYRQPGVELTGIDLSASMLERARRKLRSGRHPHVRALEVMDAHRLGFADGTFDSVVAQFTIPLVERPEQVLSECARVVRPGGQIVLVSYFSLGRGLAARVERWVGTHLRGLGLQPEFPVSRLVKWAEADGRAELIECRRVGVFGHTLVRFRRLPEAEARADRRPEEGLAAPTPVG